MPGADAGHIQVFEFVPGRADDERVRPLRQGIGIASELQPGHGRARDLAGDRVITARVGARRQQFPRQRERGRFADVIGILFEG